MIVKPYYIDIRYYKLCVSLCLLLCFCRFTYGQQSSLKPINFMDVGFTKAEIPEDLLQKRTLGIVFSDKEYQGKKVLWKEIASLSHPIITQLGIDLVCWYNASEIIIGDKMRIMLSDIMISREIDYLLLFFYENERLTIHITKFNQFWTLLDNGQPAWTFSDEKMDILLTKLKTSIIQKQLTKTNLLISDFPEFHSLEDVPEYKKTQENIRLYYEPNLKTSKLAINLPPTMYSNTINTKNYTADSLGFASALSKYPYKYKIVSIEAQEAELVKKKIIYRLFWVYGTPKQIVKTYNIDTIKWNQVKGLSTKIPMDDEYYFKAMVKNMYSEKVMCGDYWDGGKTISEALEKFIQFETYNK